MSSSRDDARDWLRRALGLDKLTRAERADYEPRIHGEARRAQPRRQPEQQQRERDHGDGRARG